MTPAPGSLLIASASLVEPTFARTLVLVLESGPEGALGVVLNRPSRTPVGVVLGGWDDVVSPPDVLFRGGPVDDDSALAVGLLAPGGAAAREDAWRSFAPPLERLGVVDLDSDPTGWGGVLTHLRVYAGYSGWGAGQLEREMAEGSWHLAPSLPGDLFTDRPDHLWHDVLRRQPTPVSLLTTLPADAALN